LLFIIDETVAEKIGIIHEHRVLRLGETNLDSVIGYVVFKHVVF